MRENLNISVHVFVINILCPSKTNQLFLIDSLGQSEVSQIINALDWSTDDLTFLGIKRTPLVALFSKGNVYLYK